MARASVQNSDDALDIVQDSMFTLARKYAHKSQEEWRPLFYRILHNRITDWHRRASVKRRLFFTRSGSGEEDGVDPVDTAPGAASVEPDMRTALDGAGEALSDAVMALPLRQRQAFLLRTLEGFNVAETARVMKCSQGSVKTHYSRAVHSLRESLEEHRI